MQILIVDDDSSIRNMLDSFLIGIGHEPVSVGTGAEALEEFERRPYEMLMLDLYLPGIDGLEVLRQVKARNPSCEVVIITAYGSLPTAVQALNMGAYAYLNKPFELIELESIVERIRELVDLRRAYQLLAQERMRPYHISNLVAVSPVMVKVRKEIEELCSSLENVLLYGEAGVGKRFIARILHFNGLVRESLNLQLNASEIEEWLTESRFIHSSGVALSSSELPDDLYRQGYGTLILNMGNLLHPDNQKALARLLHEKEARLAPRDDLPGFRIVAIAECEDATLKDAIIPELWETLSRRLRIPPLRERPECIIPVAQLFFGRYVSESGGRGFYISRPVQEFLQMYQWPGNLREMEYLVNRLSIICTSRLVSARDLQRVHRELIENHQIQDRGLEDLLTLAEKQALKRTFRKKEL